MPDLVRKHFKRGIAQNKDKELSQDFLVIPAKFRLD